jgi:dihydroflavonol-4-reductase
MSNKHSLSKSHYLDPQALTSDRSAPSSQHRSLQFPSSTLHQACNTLIQSILKFLQRFIMSQTIFVTGATGYIAKHLIFQLLEKGYTVRGSVRSLDSEDALRTDMIIAGIPEKTVTDKLSCVALDLEHDMGWDTALTSVDALMHTASPFPLDAPKDEETLIRPAVDGTLRALKAAQTAGLDRVILTSSVAAIVHYPQKTDVAAFDETDWADTKTSTAYPKSKTLAEQAAWDFVANDAPEIALTTINPGAVLGQPIGQRFGASLAIVERTLSGKDPMVPNIGFACVDVRDVAASHIAALEHPNSAGERFACCGGYLELSEFSAILKAQYPDLKIATRVAPNLLMRILALFDPTIRGIVPMLGQCSKVSSAKAQAQLGIEFRDVSESLLESAAFLLKQGRT